MADLVWFLALFIVLFSLLGILRQPPLLARERETFRYLFSPCTPYGSGVSFIGKEGRRRRKKMKIFDFFKIRFLGFYKAELKSKEYLYSGGSGLSIDIHFVDLEVSYDVLSPLPIVLSKHFNHPHPYIEIATAISDTSNLF